MSAINIFMKTKLTLMPSGSNVFSSGSLINLKTFKKEHIINDQTQKYYLKNTFLNVHYFRHYVNM